MQELLKAAAERAISYLQNLETRGVAPSAEAIANLSRFNEPLPEDPVDPQSVLQMLDEFGSPATMAIAG
ncbi:aspartate aminotransferase family protein, partial [candidate division KSB1 bacterium]|nr:aspartate aminotransferase family protein [candidate division KSB1 bacterium]